MRNIFLFVFSVLSGAPWVFAAQEIQDTNVAFIRVANQNNQARLEALVEKTPRYWNSDVLETAIARHETGVVRILIAHGVDANARPTLEKSGPSSRPIKMMSPLGEASLHAYADIVKILLAHGAKLKNSLADEASDPSPFIKEKNREEVVNLLLRRGAGVNSESGGLTALDWAAANGETSIVRILLAHGADINATQGKKTNALRAAVANGHEDIVKILKRALKSKNSVKNRVGP